MSIRQNQNILLKKDDVGLPKPSTRDLPIFGHSYGLPGARDPEGVAKRKYTTNLLFFRILMNFCYLSNFRLDCSQNQQLAIVRKKL